MRGDPPGGPGTPWTPTPGGLTYATELIELVTSLGDFCAGAAAFPLGHREAESLEADARVLKAKQDAGAEFAITELFFRVEDYFALLERCAAVGRAHPGAARDHADHQPAADHPDGRAVGPRDPRARSSTGSPAFEGDPAAVRAEGIAIATEMCDALLAGGSPGLHFYTLNRSTATREIYAGLRSTVG